MLPHGTLYSANDYQSKEQDKNMGDVFPVYAMEV
jgi:hypothetical protein